MPLALGCRQIACFDPHLPRKSAKELSFRVPDAPSQLNFKRASQFLCKSASLAGSGAEFPDRLSEAESKKKSRSIAGVDQDELVDPTLLSDPDSLFYQFEGVNIHHKICCPEEEGKIELFSMPMILLHGFGASSFSWSRVLKPLASLMGSSVLAFDRPAFGLTSRPRRDPLGIKKADDPPLNPYSIAFSVLATLSFIEKLGSQRAVLVGHSAGCLVAVDAYFESPERVAALILVAPAIFAPVVQSRERKDVGGETKNGERKEDGGERHWNVFSVVGNLLSRFSGFIVEAARKAFKVIKDLIGYLYRVILTAILRSALCRFLVRKIIDKFGIQAIRSSWYDAKNISDAIINGYTKPLRAKDWDVSLLEYTLAMITNLAPKEKPPLSTRLAEIKCPVLIITGDVDRVVPRWNAERLASAIPGSTLHVVKNCGHIPHEEKAEEFLAIVSEFLQMAFGAPSEAKIACD
ncbi:alpha/beta-Hydrolases superfamily protein [Wolffia australiana]